MEKILLGQTGLEVSRLGLGAVKFGRNEGVKYPQYFDLPPDYTLTHLLATAKELGGNLIDTAPAYGTSEERLGNLLKGHRDQWVIISKAGEEFDRGQSTNNLSPDHIVESVERSLKRLQTDYLDVLLIHSDGNDMKILSDEKLINRLYTLRQNGMVRAIGASTKTAQGGLMALELMDVVMAEYNPLYDDERVVLDRAVEMGKAVILKKILASGHLDKFKSQDPIQTAMDFAFSHPGASAAIVGTINPERLRQNVAAASLALNRISQPPASAASPGST